MMGIFSFLKRKKKDKVYIHIDEDKLKENEIIKAQQQKVMALEAQLSKIYAHEKEKRDKIDDKKKVNELNKKLNEQKLDLDAHRYGKIVWLGKFYNDVLVKKKFKKKPLEIVDKNDEVVLGKWGDFGIMEGGKFCIKDIDGNLMSYGKNLNQILYKPDAFENMCRRGRFTIPVDKDGNWLEDVEYKEIPEPLDAEFDEKTGQVKRIIWSKVKTSEVKKIIADKMEKINYLYQELEIKDSSMIKLKEQIDDLKRSLRIYEAQGNIAQSELSKALHKFIETEKRLGDQHSQIIKLTEMKATYENLIDRKDSLIDTLIKKLELTGEPKLDRLKASIKDDLEFYKAILPDRVEIKQEVEKEVKPSQPGELIKS